MREVLIEEVDAPQQEWAVPLDKWRCYKMIYDADQGSPPLYVLAVVLRFHLQMPTGHDLPDEGSTFVFKHDGIHTVSWERVPGGATTAEMISWNKRNP